METKLKLNTPLSTEEIYFRVQSINKGKYATILAYKDARCDMNRLDAVYGVEYWQKKYELINGNLFCSIGIWSGQLNQWIWKQDVGTESNTEKEKGEASDAFKRACFNLGIGRELYDYPIIQVKLNDDECEVKSDKVYPSYNFKLKEWVWESLFNEQNKLIKLTAKDDKGNIRFTYPAVKSAPIPPKTLPSTTATELPPLDDKRFLAMLDAIAKGKGKEVIEATKKYTVLPQQLKAIEEELKKLNK